MSRSPMFAAAMQAYDEDRNEDALRLIMKCASLGDPIACYLTAFWFRNGEGTAPDAEKCDHWIRELVQLAQGGDAEAQWELSCKYRWGNLLAIDYLAANDWLERAAKNGWGEAQHHLAWYLETGQYEYAQDVQAAEDWYQRALAQGHPETVYTFALRAFKDGKITEKAIALLKRAADKGFRQASHVLYEHSH